MAEVPDETRIAAAITRRGPDLKVIIAGILAVLILAGAGAYFWSRHQAPAMTTQYQAVPRCSPNAARPISVTSKDWARRFPS